MKVSNSNSIIFQLWNKILNKLAHLSCTSLLSVLRYNQLILDWKRDPET